MHCVVFGLMHTGTNVWTEMLSCDPENHRSSECQNVSDQPWKHVPLNFRAITPQPSCKVYVTSRECNVWIEQMHKNAHDFLLRNDSVVAFEPRRKRMRETQNRHFAYALHRRPIVLKHMCENHNNRARLLAANNMVTMLPFDTICKQINRPLQDSRKWLKRKSHKCLLDKI